MQVNTVIMTFMSRIIPDGLNSMQNSLNTVYQFEVCSNLRNSLLEKKNIVKELQSIKLMVNFKDILYMYH